MKCRNCGEIVDENERVCPKCGEPIEQRNEMAEGQVDEAESDFIKERKKGKITIVYNKVYKFIRATAIIFILLMLIWYTQIWPRNVYKKSCKVLENKAFSNEDCDYEVEKFNEKYITEINKSELKDFGEGKLHYHHFYLRIPVKIHTDEYGDMKWEYEMDMYIHAIGEDGVFKKIVYVQCSGEPTWIEDLRNAFEE